MKKFFKTTGICLLAGLIATSAMAMSVSALNGEGKCTVSIGTNANNVTGTYKIYKVATVTPNGGAFDYAWTTNFASYATDYDLESVVSGYSNDSDEVKALANKLAMTAKNLTAADETGTIGDSIDILPGYYLVTVVTSDAGIITQPSLFVITDESAKAFDIKASTISFNKTITKITDGSFSTSGKTGVAGLGATVSYKLEADIPSYAAGVSSIDPDMSIKDTPSAGLTLVDANEDDKVDVTVTLNGTSVNATNYTVSNTETDGSFTITFHDDWVVVNGGGKVAVAIDAVVNSGAVAINNNDATLTYANQYATGAGTGTIDSPSATVFTTDYNVTKTFSDYKAEENPIAGFTLYKGNKAAVEAAIAAGTQDTLKVGDEQKTDGTNNKQISFDRLGTGKYTLVETTVPAGYKKAANKEIEITAAVDGTTNEYTINSFTKTDNGNANITNTKGSTLPGTGGVGTTMFTIGGIALVVVAGGMLTIYMKKRKTSEEE